MIKRKDNNQCPGIVDTVVVLACAVRKCADPGFKAKCWILALRELTAQRDGWEGANPSIAGWGCDQGKPRT